ncbi:MAG TPA: hypothetical protein VFG53_05540 [Anaeromyxobacter sp.]|nr:hypothetical protein [Anaeromyxobacter sp.]
MKELMEIARLRAEGMKRLEAIAEESGSDSKLYHCCRELWFEREAGTDLSVVSGDWKNAITLLQLGVHVLVHGPDVLKKDELPIDDAVELLRGV